MEPKNPVRVLFLCIHNSARSQMAEALLRQDGGGAFQVASAGLQPGEINPLAVQAMAEIGIDIFGQQAKNVFDYIRASVRFDFVITLCHDGDAICPIYPGFTNRLHWPVADPAAFQGTDEEKLEETRRVRDAIKEKIRQWLFEMGVKPEKTAPPANEN